jgi:hypothetical protein
MNSNTMRKVECHSLFDITDTGINGHTRNIAFPITDKNGNQIMTSAELNRARNQQRNFDTLLQLIGLRTQIFSIESPKVCSTPLFPGKKCWQFSFEIEDNAQWLVDRDEFWVLKQDSDSTPMITGLTEDPDLDPILNATGTSPNIIYHAEDNK